jgi:hypothetical protein
LGQTSDLCHLSSDLLMKAAEGRAQTGAWCGRSGRWSSGICPLSSDLELLARPGDDPLSHPSWSSTLGAARFHGRVRNGVGWSPCAVVTRPSEELKVRGQMTDARCQMAPERTDAPWRARGRVGCSDLARLAPALGRTLGGLRSQHLGAVCRSVGDGAPTPSRPTNPQGAPKTSFTAEFGMGSGGARALWSPGRAKSSRSEDRCQMTPERSDALRHAHASTVLIWKAEAEGRV